MNVVIMSLTLSWRRPLSYRNQSIDLQSKSMNWFLFDNGLPHERVNVKFEHIQQIQIVFLLLSLNRYLFAGSKIFAQY